MKNNVRKLAVKKQHINTLETSLIALSLLSISEDNMRRHGVEGIKELAENIKEVGLIKPLSVRENKGKYEIVAGQRRFRAFELLNEQDGVYSEIPCVVLQSDEEDDAALSLSENVFSSEMDALQRCEAFNHLKSNGATFTSIAKRFGMNVRQVKQNIALGGLSDLVRATFRGGEVVLSEGVMRLLVRFAHDRQDEYIQARISGDLQGGGYWANRYFYSNDVDAKFALFDVKKEKLVMSKDLFSDDVYVTDIELFWKLQMKAVNAKKKKLEKDGWKVVVFEPNNDNSFCQSNYGKLAKEDGGVYVFSIDGDGEVNEYEGVDLTPQEGQSVQEVIGGDAGVGAKAKQRQELTAGAQEYYSDWHYQMVRAKLAEDELLSMRVFVAHLVSKTVIEFETAKPINEKGNQQLHNHGITSSLNERIDEIKSSLGIDVDWSSWHVDLDSMLDRLKDKTMVELTHICSTVMLATIQKDTSLIEKLGVNLKINPLDYWKADAESIDSISSKDATWAVAQELVPADDLGVFTNLALVSRRENLVKNLKDDFIPPYMCFPISQYGEVKLNINKG